MKQLLEESTAQLLINKPDDPLLFRECVFFSWRFAVFLDTVFGCLSRCRTPGSQLSTRLQLHHDQF